MKLNNTKPLKEHLVDELTQPGDWVVANISDPVFWPLKVQKFTYRGETLFILPVTTDHYPAVAMRLRPPLDRLAGQRLILRFLSAVAWVEGQAVIIEYWTGGGRPQPMGRTDAHRQLNHGFDLSYLPEPADEKACLALALYREGKALNHKPYAFLSYFRVLDGNFAGSAALKKWINDNVDALDSPEAKKIAARLRITEPDIGKYLYESGRCAVAHARSEPLIDPDDPLDWQRLDQELPLIAALAVHYIEKELGVETTFTVYRKHLYELAGFKRLFGEDIVAQLLRGETSPADTLIDIPYIHVQLLDHAPYAPMIEMRTLDLGVIAPSVVEIHLGSADGMIRMRFQLDFKNERLLFDVANGIYGGKDDGSSLWAATMAEVRRFMFDYMCNGSLRLIDAESGLLLSRKEAFLPVNVIVDGEASRKEIQHWRDEAERRKLAEAGQAAAPPGDAQAKA